MYNKEVPIEYTLSGSLKKVTKRWHDAVTEPNNMIVSTNVDGIFRKGDSISVRYKGAGVYKKYYPIDVIVTMYPDSPTTEEMLCSNKWGETSAADNIASRKERNYSVFFTNDTTKVAHFDRANYFDGIRYAHAYRPEFVYEYVYAGTNRHIERTYGWFSWGSLNYREGVNSKNSYTEYFKKNGAQPDVYPLQAGTHGLTTPFLPTYPGFLWVYVWDQQLPFLYNKSTDGFEDHVDGEDFWKSIGSMYCVTDTPGVFRFRMLTSSFWFVPSVAALGPTAPEPEKFIRDGTENKTEVTKSPNSEIEFRVSQDVSTYGYYGSSFEKYSSFSLEDKLPSEVEYVSAKVERSWEHSSATGTTDDFTRFGTLTYNNSTHTVKFAFSSDFLRNTMGYMGETYTLVIKCRIKNTTRQDFTNQAKTTICGDEQSTNIVTVKVPVHKIETEVVNGTITPTEINIPEGEDRTISYSPNTGYYLKSITVDGVDVSITDYTDDYSFENITADHKIKVVYAKNPYIVIQKQIDISKVIWAKGTPEFFYLVNGVDWQGINRKYCRYIGFNTSSVNQKQVTLYIPSGLWTVTEYPINDWQLLKSEAIDNGTVSGNSVVLDTRNADSATAKFTNDISDYSNYTHNETKVNNLK